MFFTLHLKRAGQDLNASNQRRNSKIVLRQTEQSSSQTHSVLKKTKDPANDFTFAIFVKDEKLGLIAEFPDDRDSWIEALDFARKRQMAVPSGSTYEFVWDISIKEEGIAKGTSIFGDGRLAKNGTSLVFMKKNADDVTEELCLSSVRRSGQADSFLLLEIGRSHPIGPGELWIEAQDTRTAENMYAVIFGSNVVRPKSYMFSERSRTSSQSMTNRRRSDGADKAKPGKRSFLPFLRSKLKDTDTYAEKNFSLKSKRSHSAADIRKLGVNSNDVSYAKLLLAHQNSTPASNSTTDVRRDSTVKRKEKSKRISLFRSKKHEVSKSVQDLHTIYADTEGTLPRENRVSVLKTQYEMNSSLSAQNITSLDRESPAPSPAPSPGSSRMANIKKLSQMNAKSSLTSSSSTSNIPGEINRRKMANGRPVTMMIDALADDRISSLLRKTRWKSLDNGLKDSPTVSSEDCSSADSSHSYESLNGVQIAPTAGDSPRSRRPLADEGYVRMDYNYDEEKPYANLHDPKLNGRRRQNNDPKTNSVYMWISPDAGMPNEEPEDQGSYMDKSPMKSLEFNVIRKKFSEQTEKTDENRNIETKSSGVYTLIGPATNTDEPNTFKVQDERQSDDGEQPTVTLPPRYKREISTQSTTSSDSKITRCGPASVSSAGEEDYKPAPLPRKSKLEKSVPSNEDRIAPRKDEVNDESPPLPPKCNRQLSYQRSFSDEEKVQSSSSASPRKVSPQNSLCNINRPVPLPPNYHREVSESSSHSDEDRRVQNSPTPAAIVGRPLPTLPRTQEVENGSERNRHSASYSPEKMKGRPVPLPPGSSSAESRARSREEPRALNKVKRSLSAQNSAPLPTRHQRTTSEQTVNSEQEYFKISTSKDRRQTSPRSSVSDDEKPVPVREQRAFSARSPTEDEVFAATPTSPEKRSLWKDIGKRMTVNFKQRKTTAAARVRQSEACRSHFYVDTGPVLDQKNVSPLTETESHLYEERERADHSGLSEGGESPIRKQPARPNSLNLNLRPKSSVEQREVCDVRDSFKENIYTTVDVDHIEHDTSLTQSVRKTSPTQGSEYSTVLQTKTNQDFDRTKQVYKRVGHSYETVYTEVTLKDKDSESMPMIKSLKRVKKKGKDVEINETIPEIRPQDFGETDVPQRKVSQKIVSSPTKDPKGYENISLREGIITTPLDEIEGRPYMNLGFHKGKGKHEGKKSGDEAALKLLMNLQTEKKIGDEITVRRQSRGEVFTPTSPTKGISDTIKLLPVDLEEEVSYVNVGRDHQLTDNKGRRMLNSTDSEDGNDYMNIGRHASERSTDGEDEAYQNLSFQRPSRKGSDFASDDLPTHAESAEYANIVPHHRQSPSTKAKSNVEDIYTHIGAQDADETNQTCEIPPINERKKERPVPKPRSKKPERRKISQEPTSKSKNPYDHVDISPKNNRAKNDVPTPSPFGAYDMSEPSYINVGSYHDEFDVSNVGSKMPAAKSRSYENLADEFVPRRYRKKSQEYGLEYADVELVGFKSPEDGRHDTEDDDPKYAELAIEKADQNSPLTSNKHSPTTKQKGSPRSRGGVAYTEVDFMKSQGITEAMRNRRTESSDDIGREGQVQ